jgi:hypothetical protein
MDLSFLLMFVNSSKVGGWVRAGVAAGFPMLIAKFPFLSDYFDTATQVEIAGALSGIAVAIWSHFSKSLGAGAVGANAAAAIRAQPGVSGQ